MDDSAYSLSTFFTFGVVVLIIGLYQWSSWTWKTRPWVPFVFGVSILLGASLLDWRVESAVTVAKTAATSAKSADRQQSSELFSAVATVGERQLKLLELVAIPLAVSLIVAALLLRVERQFGLRVSDYVEARRELRAAQKAAKAATANLHRAMDDRVPGRELLNLHREAAARQRIALHQFLDVADRFANLVHSRADPGLNGEDDEG